MLIPLVIAWAKGPLRNPSTEEEDDEDKGPEEEGADDIEGAEDARGRDAKRETRQSSQQQMMVGAVATGKRKRAKRSV